MILIKNKIYSVCLSSSIKNGGFVDERSIKRGRIFSQNSLKITEKNVHIADVVCEYVFVEGLSW